MQRANLTLSETLTQSVRLCSTQALARRATSAKVNDFKTIMEALLYVQKIGVDILNMNPWFQIESQTKKTP